MIVWEAYYKIGKGEKERRKGEKAEKRREKLRSVWKRGGSRCEGEPGVTNVRKKKICKVKGRNVRVVLSGTRLCKVVTEVRQQCRRATKVGMW